MFFAAHLLPSQAVSNTRQNKLAYGGTKPVFVFVKDPRYKPTLPFL